MAVFAPHHWASRVTSDWELSSLAVFLARQQFPKGMSCTSMSFDNGWGCLH